MKKRINNIELFDNKKNALYRRQPAQRENKIKQSKNYTASLQRTIYIVYPTSQYSSPLYQFHANNPEHQKKGSPLVVPDYGLQSQY